MAPIEKGNGKDEESASGEVEHHASTTSNSQEMTCWGCGLRLQLKSYSPIFKCGWCGAITDKGKSLRKPDSPCFSKWRHIRDRFFVTLLLLFMLFVICAGVWAVYPIVFTIGYICGIFHCIVTFILSVITISTFCLASFTCPGAPSHIQWGSYPIVGKYGLDNYTYCTYCKKPKPQRAHHCRSCRMCVMDMDHHCPFIGNCVGAANHRYFIAFLISVIIGCTYVFLMSIFAGYHVWPPLKYDSVIFRTSDIMSIVKEMVYALASSALLLSTRGLVLIYLAFASLSVETGISMLLWQQLSYIYEGNTYINQISSDNSAQRERGCHNLSRFFGCPYSLSKIRWCPGFPGKTQQISNSKHL